MQTVKLLCLQRKVKPTIACKESGVGGSFINDVERGRVPSVVKFQMLANYLGVTTSELLGEVPMGSYSRPAAELVEIKPSGRSLEVAIAYDATTPELQAAVRRVLGLD